MVDRKAWDYLEVASAPDAPAGDNPSGLYCHDCRRAHAAHCSAPEWCGGMRRMTDPTTERCQPAQVEASNTDAATQNTGILPSHGDKR